MYNEVLIIVLVSLCMLFLWFISKKEENVREININFTKTKKEEIKIKKENKNKEGNKEIEKIEFLNKIDNHKIDNFLKIEGIGPKINNLLHQNNINNYEVLSKTKVEDLEKILEKAGSTYTLANPKNWIEDAKLLHENKLENFKNNLY